MLQIQPDKDIVIEFIKQEDYKYARAIGAFYLRLVGESAEIYKYLETLYNDFRKIKKQDNSGKFSLIHMDEFIDSLLTEERRSVLEEANVLESRQSLLDEDLEDLQYNEELDEISDGDIDTTKEKNKGRKHEDGRDYRERSKDRDRARERHHRRHRDESPHLNHRERRDRERDYDRERRKDKEDKERREKDKSRRRSRSRSADRARDRGRRAEREYSPDKYRNGRDRERGYRH
nr:unnamed protein product [Spirometra erinaceieuropaei]